MKTSPCKNCPQEKKDKYNFPECHITCHDYILWKEYRDEINEKIKRENESIPVEIIDRNATQKIKNAKRRLY